MNSTMQPDLNFEGQNTLYATHGMHAYAAKCPPQLAHYAIERFSSSGDLVLDPMAGSGTTLVEARIQGRNSIGFDLDPLSCLISLVKSTNVSDDSLRQAFGLVLGNVKSDLKIYEANPKDAALQSRLVIPEFLNRDYWFLPSVQNSLALFANHISESQIEEAARDFLWLVFSSTILAKNSVANARDIIHSRHHYLEHVETPDVITKFTKRFGIMRKQMAEFRKLCSQTPAATAKIYRADARYMPIKNEIIDLIFTSPPYATALDYTRAHFLAVAWMQNRLGVSFDVYKKDGEQYIGSERGKLEKAFVLDETIQSYESAVNVIEQLCRLDMRRARLVHRYFVSMQQVFQEMNWVLKPDGHLVIVVCPSHIRKIDIPTHQVFNAFAESLNLRLVQEYTRNIDQRKRLLPYMQGALGNRMNLEYVLIYQKAGNRGERSGS